MNTPNPIVETYIERHRRSAELYAEAQKLLPSGLTHDARHSMPFPLYMERSSGARKWDADGNELIDYWTGHGSLLLGHGHPAVVEAVQAQMARGTHLGAEHAQILRWSALVQQCFPSIETLRFTASGTEATQMALRLARAFTGREPVVRLLGHYHGWHDALTHGMDIDSADVTPPGLLRSVADATIAVLPSLAAIETALKAQPVAAVILEPTGASYGMSPLPDAFLGELRDLAHHYGALLICDEVVTGFRLAPGGVQERSGVRADLTTLAKVLAGGLPGGAGGGRADIMQLLAFGNAAWNRTRKIRHNGTFNANPLSAAAGVATLERVVDGTACAQANAAGTALVQGLNDAIRERGLHGWAAYGDGSIFHVLAGSSVPFAPGELSPEVPLAEIKRGGDAQILDLLKLALINHGVDFMRGHSGFLSIAHGQAELNATIAAFGAALDDVCATVQQQVA